MLLPQMEWNIFEYYQRGRTFFPVVANRAVTLGYLGRSHAWIKCTSRYHYKNCAAVGQYSSDVSLPFLNMTSTELYICMYIYICEFMRASYHHVVAGVSGANWG